MLNGLVLLSTYLHNMFLDHRVAIIAEQNNKFVDFDRARAEF